MRYKLSNLYGPLSAEMESRLSALLQSPTIETWDDAYCICINGFKTLWQYVCRVDPTFPRSGNITDKRGRQLRGWARVPDEFTLHRALALAAREQPKAA